MKKIMIACAAVALAAVAQAASIDWAITGNTWKDPNGSNADKGTTVYLIDAAQWSTIESAINGGATSFTTADAGILGVATTGNAKGQVSSVTATSSALKAGQSYDYAYLVLMDNKYFASGTMNKAAYDPTDAVYSETTSIMFNANHSTDSASLSGGWADVKTSDIPEPTSGLLLLLGVAGLALRRKNA